MTQNEKDYISGLNKGDKVIFEQIFKDNYSRLCNIALRYVNSKDEAEEIVQNFFCKLWEIKHTIEIKTSLNSYLSRSVVNFCLNNYRSKRIEGKLIDYSDENIDEFSTESSQIIDYELEEKINEAILKMPEKRRDIFLLSKYEGLKYKEIASQLDISIKTVETQMNRAFKFLKEDLKDFLKEDI